jgi:diaminopimelate epimerase
VTTLVKVEGAGNDFLLGLGEAARRLADDVELVVRLCDRHRGLGADGALAVLPRGDASVRLVHRNSDGSRSTFCANGTRCAALAAVLVNGLPDTLTIVTDWATVPAQVRDDTVTLELPAPSTPREVELRSGMRVFPGWLLSVGVPHFVVATEGLAEVDMAGVAAPLRHHPGLGDDGANIHFVEHRAGGSLTIRSFERGVPDEVLCCGSGVVAAALVALGTARAALTVRPRSGDELEVEALDEAVASRCRLTGPARLVARIEPFDW